MSYTFQGARPEAVHYTGQNQVTDLGHKETEDQTNNNNNSRTEPCFNEFSVNMDNLELVSCRSAELQSRAGSDIHCDVYLIEKWFEACDPRGLGKVRVSDLVDYLRTSIDANLQEDGAVGSLIEILDPDNMNAEVGIDTLQSGLSQWISEMKTSSMNSSIEQPNADSIIMSFNESLRENAGLEISVEESLIDDRLADSQYHNLKLTRENLEARATIDIKEEELVKQYHELGAARSQIRRLQEQLDILNETESENEELRQQLMVSNKDMDELKKKIILLNQEKLTLQNQLNSCHIEIAKLSSELAQAQDVGNELKFCLAESKEKVMELKDTCSNMSSKLTERDEKYQELSVHLQEMSKYNEELKNQNRELQGQLKESQLEISSLKSANECSNGIVLPSLKELTEDIEEDTDQSETNSVSEWPLSIRNELRDLLGDGPGLPWPLSEKELKDSVVATPDLGGQVENASPSYSSSLECEFSDSSANSEESSNRESLRGKSSPKQDPYYDISNEKLRVLVSLLKNFREENRKLRHLVKRNLNLLVQTEKLEDKAVSRERQGAVEVRQESSQVKKLQECNAMLVSQVNSLKRANIDLSERLHKSEVKISELDEEAQNASSSLEKEKLKCAELEENLCSSTLARQLDLRDIWRLVQKDVETECQDQQEDVMSSGNTDQIKENIKRDIEALRTKLEKREAALGALKKNNLNLRLLWNYEDIHPSNNWFNGHKVSPGSPLVDALSIDAFNGNLPMYSSKYPYTSSVSCEDVDCYECRAARMLLQNRYTSSCPSIGPANGNQPSNSTIYNYNNNYKDYTAENTQTYSSGYSTDNGQGTHLDALSGQATDLGSLSLQGINFRSTSEQTADQEAVSAEPEFTPTHKRQRSLYGSHRRKDFIRSSGRFLVESNSQNSEVLITSVKSLKQSENSCVKDNPVYPSQGEHTQQNSKEAASESISSGINYGVRRPSFKLAVENNSGIVKYCSESGNNQNQLDSFTEELRRPSFCAAIELGKPASPGPVKRKVVQITSPESLQVRTKRSRDVPTTPTYSDSAKTVTFQLDDGPGEEYSGAWGCGYSRYDPPGENVSSFSPTSSYSSSASLSMSNVNNSFSSMSTSSLSQSFSQNSRFGSLQGKKLQMLLEDDQAYCVPKCIEDWDMSPQHTGDGNTFTEAFRASTEYDEEDQDDEEYLASISQECLDLSDEVTETVTEPDFMPNTSVNGTGAQTRHKAKDGAVKPHRDKNSQSSDNSSELAAPPRATKGGDILDSTPRITHSTSPINSGRSQITAGKNDRSQPVTSTPVISGSAPMTSEASLSQLTPSLHMSPVTPVVPPGVKTPAGDRDLGSQGTKSNSEGTKGNNSRCSDDGSSSGVHSPRTKTVVPESPPTARNALSSAVQVHPVGPSRLSAIRQSHLAIKRRDQKSRGMKLPELAENTVLDTSLTVPDTTPAVPDTTPTGPDTTPRSTKALNTCPSLSLPRLVMPHISVTNSDAEVPPPPSDDPVTPSLPASFLKKLGLAVKGVNGESEKSSLSVDQLPEKEIESKFISLSLAFKTDKLTLDQRVSVQERSRDLAEQNVDKELNGLREAVEVLWALALNEVVTDPQVRGLIQKMRQHVDILEQAAARVSSRAEVFGAVQQERRMCKAMEVMVLYTENLRRIREKEESELMEARKILSERSNNGYSLDGDSSPSRRSMSVCGVNAIGRPPARVLNYPMNEAGDNPDSFIRRRSEIALPRVLGGSGSPSLTLSPNMESASPSVERSSNLLAVAGYNEGGEDAKSRFQTAVASTSMQNAVTTTMKRVSGERQRASSMCYTPSPVSLVPSLLSASGDAGGTSLSGKVDEKSEGLRTVSHEEEAFRKGFEEGLKHKLSQELNELRDQQNSISHSLEHMMDRVEQSQQEEEELLARPTRLETMVSLVSRLKTRLVHHDWRSNKKAIRNIAGVIFVLLAVLIVFLSPPISTVDVRHVTKPPQ
ncbi:uncharacterized protein LOC131956567 [Physella acuta]|uniref:uncharacterized protein LOC131956567 n=1 Tax=Physella acuta TaxID=109671 RepID=UPI0027DB6FF4|nr:uncharacterized protein LOC131956567 [Physella acuta]